MLFDHSAEPMMRLLVNSTRQAHVSGPELAEAHRGVGRALTTSIAHHLVLEDVSIDHVAGTSVGVQLKTGSEPIIVALIRGGLFVAEGVWSSLPGSSLVLHAEGANLDNFPVEQRTVIIVDSVINSGHSVRNVLTALGSLRPSSIAVAALVAFKTSLHELVDDFPEVSFHVGRVSDRSYVGIGATDTGARLFGTTTWACEA